MMQRWQKASPLAVQRTFALTISIAMLAAIAFAADGAWLAKVPARDRERANPFEGQSDAVAAGRRVFLDHCAQCHGEKAEGTKKRPPLRSEAFSFAK